MLCTLTRAPLALFFSFASRMLHHITRSVAASSQSAQSEVVVGLGSDPSHAWSSFFLLPSSLKRDVSKYFFACSWLLGCPHSVKTRGEWFKSLLSKGADSILPPRVCSSWETRNLSMQEIVAPGSDHPLSNVYSFFDIL